MFICSNIDEFAGKLEELSSLSSSEIINMSRKIRSKLIEKPDLNRVSEQLTKVFTSI